jgi:xylulose-5-phosphate/fructose-6-phosphate phosphoketolase
MMLVNRTSRYHVAAAAVRGGAKHNPRICTDATELAARFMHMAQRDHEYILMYGEGQIYALLPWSLPTFTDVDPVGTFDTPKFG